MTQAEWTVAFAGDVWRVKAAQLALEGQGIDTFVPDEVPAQDPHLSGTPLSSIALYVRAHDLARARKILGAQ